jgi:hypothetical protein
MPVIEEGIEQLQQEFANARILTDEPGFYEDPAFIRREAKVPHYLDNYARFVQQQPYSLTYLDRAEPIIHVVSEELQLALKEDGTPEAHAEATFVMSRILEREGVWNYVASGSLSMTFPAGSGFEPFSFPAFNVQCGKAIECSYRWVVAPPFQVIDIAIQACRYPYPFNHLLPKIVWEPSGEPAIAEMSDFFGANALKEIAKTGMTMDEALDRYLPNYRSGFAPDFSPRSINRLDTQLKYVPTGVVAAENSLEQFTGFKSRGLTAAQIYAQKIRPRLSQPQMQ